MEPLRWRLPGARPTVVALVVAALAAALAAAGSRPALADPDGGPAALAAARAETLALRQRLADQEAARRAMVATAAARARAHVGMYVGQGLMVHAPHTGALVRVDAARPSGYAGAGRPGRKGSERLGLGPGRRPAPGELDGVVPAVGARVVLGQRIAALAADAAQREALLPALAGSGVGSGALHRASLGAHVKSPILCRAGLAARPPCDDLKVCHPPPGRRKAVRGEPPGQR
jgi:hypothetical protein